MSATLSDVQRRAWLRLSRTQNVSVSLNDEEANRIRVCIEEALGPSPVEVDELVRGCSAPVSAVLSVLLEMELAGRVARHSGNRVSWA